MFQFSCSFAFFINFSSFEPDTENYVNFDAVSSKCGNFESLTLFIKGDKIWIKNLYECKGCNARQFIEKFLSKGWMKNSISRLLVKFGTVDRRPGSGRCSVHTDDNVVTVESLLLSQEDKPQSHRTVREISLEAGGSIDHQF